MNARIVYALPGGGSIQLIIDTASKDPADLELIAAMLRALASRITEQAEVTS